MKDKLLERKKSLEAEIKQVIQQRADVTEKMLKPAQQAISELVNKHQSLDISYQEVCRLLELNPQKEWVKAKDVKEIPVEATEIKEKVKK